jgi:signal transduction histidine kinase
MHASCVPGTPMTVDVAAARLASTTDEALVAQQVRERFVEMFLAQSRRSQAGLIVSAALIAFTWATSHPPIYALGWLALVATVVTLRVIYSERFVRSAPQGRTTHRIAALLLVNGILLALPLMGFAGWSDVQRTAYSLIVMATVTASVATTCGYRSVFLAFAAPILVPLAAAWAFQHPDEGSHLARLGVGALIIVFMVFLLGIAKQTQQTFVEASRYRYSETLLARDLRAALDRADESNRAKTQFLAAASHDLRQPIHSINVLIAALQLRPLDARSAEIVKLLVTVNQSLSSQLDSLLDISKLDAGVVRPRLDDHRLDEMLRRLATGTAGIAAERGLRLEPSIETGITAHTDDGLLSRAIGNLIDNAIKYTPRGGTLRVALERRDGHAVITIADSGIGIAEAEREHVFREFYQVGNVERDRAKGLGLGLSIVQRLCALLGVTLNLESALGRGTTFTLRLPEVAASYRAIEQQAIAADLRAMSILVIDDEAVVRRSMELLLSELGCTVHLAASREDAVRIAQQHGIDLVLSDYRLGNATNGVDAIRAVQAVHPQARAALITGDTAPERLREAKASGLALLHKPVTLDALMRVLHDTST